MNHNRVYFFFALQLIAVSIQAQYTSLTGTIIDKKTKEPLPYANIKVKDHFLGTMSGENGKFLFHIPDSLVDQTVQFTFLGYHTFEKKILDFQKNDLKIKLEPATNLIEEVIIRPISAEEMLLAAIRNIEDNYPQTPFVAEGFYREQMMENNIYLQYAEGFVEVYTPPYGDTNKCQAKLIEGRVKDSVGEMHFLRKLKDKMYSKQLKKYEKGKDTVKPVKGNPVQVVFSGPNDILLDDVVRNKDLYLDSNSFNKFKISYEKDNFIGDNKLYVIRCKSKRAINYSWIDAMIYIDTEDLAIVKITRKSVIKIPRLLNKAMALYRISPGLLEFYSDLEFKKVEDYWYPHKVIENFNGEITKKYFGGTVEHSMFDMGEAFVITNIKPNNVKPFLKNEIMTNEPLADQIKETHPEFWENKNVVGY